MVNLMKGHLVECDAPMKQLLLHLDETQALGRKFVIQDLDDTHIFIVSEIVDVLKDRINDVMDRINAPASERDDSSN